MGQLQFYQLLLNYNYMQLNQLQLHLQLQTITVKPMTVIAVIKLSVIITITITFQSELTTPLLVLLPAGIGRFIVWNFYRYFKKILANKICTG